ncbi:hypothetical protein ACFOW1_10295 [Parasediminibacterium paludis]|uniref:Uncharacterized protein n=1 Tax=Parasediminibacterium paludis TaxID=908966 RepID=A0ABV8PZ97_9BACT
MDETLKLQHGESVAKVYELISNDLADIDDKYTDLKDQWGNHQKASHFYLYTFEPVKLSWNDNPPQELKNDVMAVFDKYLKRTDI